VSTAPCIHCGRARGSGSAKGWCARCYRHTLRHGGELPSLLQRGEVASEQLAVRLAPALLSHVREAARREGCTPVEWLRRAARERVLRQALPTRR